MTDFGRRAGDMRKSVYDADDDGVVDAAQTVIPHKTSHQDEGVDEISVADLSGELADEQPSAWTKVSGKPSTFAPSAHKTTHQDGGADEISVAGLVGTTPRAIFGDATAGRVLRGVVLSITNGTDDYTIKSSMTNRWNGDTIALTDNIVKGATTGHFTLSADGQSLIIEAAGLSGNVLYAFASLHTNASDLALDIFIKVTSNDIELRFPSALGGSNEDITHRVETGFISINIFYITDA